jgi:ABC-type transport system involved in multi-copper enzyme maturation permease subunit
MDFSNVRAVAVNDFNVFRKRKSIMYSIIALPLSISIFIPVAIFCAEKDAAISLQALFPTNSFSYFYFIILATIIPTVVAAYSFIGEKIERSLEPLLGTPLTDSELLLGKSMVPFLLSVASIYGSAAVFMFLMEAFTADKLTYTFFANWLVTAVLLIAAPLACMLSVELNVIISARVNDVRAAGQLGRLVALPFAGIYFLAEARFLSLDTASLTTICVLLLSADAALMLLNKSVFRREEILTKWK